jgi:hypothetical protein
VDRISAVMGQDRLLRLFQPAAHSSTAQIAKPLSA